MLGHPGLIPRRQLPLQPQDHRNEYDALWNLRAPLREAVADQAVDPLPLLLGESSEGGSVLCEIDDLCWLSRPLIGGRCGGGQLVLNWDMHYPR